MFTGLVEETGRIEAIEHTVNAVTLTVSADVCLGGTNTGDSIAVNGCCLTAIKVIKRGKSRGFKFDLLRETWDVTNLSSLRRGSTVNLEKGGDLGYCTRLKQLPRQIDDVVFVKEPVPGVYGPIGTKQGLHLVYLHSCGEPMGRTEALFDPPNSLKEKLNQVGK